MSTLWQFLHANAEIIIALCALALTVQQGLATRKHERLSVRPYLMFDRILKLEDGTIQLVLENNGPGTAFIKNMEVFFDDTLQEQGPKIWHEIGEKLELPLKSGGGRVLGAGDGIPPHSTTVLAHYKSEEPMVKLGDEALNSLRRIRVRIAYASAFGEVFGADSKLHFL